MQVKFKDGQTFNCSTPTEQKIFKSGTMAGWILIFPLLCDMTSEDVDALLTEENISELTFTSEETEFSLSGYNKISSTVIKYSTEKEKTRIEIHLIKGV